MHIEQLKKLKEQTNDRHDDVCADGWPDRIAASICTCSSVQRLLELNLLSFVS